ncbi:AAA domain protein [Mycobacterium xenopi 4042]|uniref:AAA domain protein n=1 Tax=Mycobacterium xenopi 4042 TaxID=1299334 RepID=X8E074_MYCXE|nr:AAA domain protein [Mycobacterium xenopi 4042]
MAETLPPPHTKVQPRSAIASPSRAANASRSGWVGPDAQYTQIAHCLGFIHRNVDQPCRGAHFDLSPCRFSSAPYNPAMRWVAELDETAVQQVTNALESPHVSGAVLVGADGVGKTSLARAAAGRFAARRPSTIVRWVAGTSSERMAPFGAFRHLVTLADIGRPAALLRAARESLTSADGDLLLVVDDAHDLDSLSATLVYQLALTGSARLVVTVHSEAPMPDVVAALWTDQLLSRIEVRPLDAAGRRRCWRPRWDATARRAGRRDLRPQPGQPAVSAASDRGRRAGAGRRRLALPRRAAVAAVCADRRLPSRVAAAGARRAGLPGRRRTPAPDGFDRISRRTGRRASRGRGRLRRP